MGRRLNAGFCASPDDAYNPPMNFPDVVTLAVPFFVLLIVLEMAAWKLTGRRSFETRDAAASLAGLTTGLDVDVLVAGGADDLDDLRHLRDAGVAGVILGEVLFTGRISLGDAQRALA